MTLPKISPELIQAYQEQIANSSSEATVKRKEASLNKFFDWAKSQGHIAENPLAKALNSKPEILNNSKIQNPKSPHEHLALLE